MERDYDYYPGPEQPDRPHRSRNRGVIIGMIFGVVIGLLLGLGITIGINTVPEAPQSDLDSALEWIIPMIFSGLLIFLAFLKSKSHQATKAEPESYQREPYA